MRFPNLVIGGAPKCGTTSLFAWLVDHPDVCGSKSKEPYFLVDKDHPSRRKECNIHDHGLEAYARVFPGCTDRHKVVVEASTHYLYQSTPLEVLASLPNAPRVLFLVRKPSERIYSSFAYSKNKGNVRPDLTFPEFIGLIRDNSEPVAMPDWSWRVSGYVLPRDILYSRYIDYLQPWRERLDKERLRVVVLETLRANPKAAVQELCDWLGIDPAYYDDYDFAPRNRTSPVRSRGIQRIAQSLAATVSPGPVKEAIKRIYFAVQSTGRQEPRSEADKAILAELNEEFRPYNERLARAFGLNLSAWE